MIGNNVHDIALGQSLNGGIDTMLFEDVCIYCHVVTAQC